MMRGKLIGITLGQRKCYCALVGDGGRAAMGLPRRKITPLPANHAIFNGAITCNWRDYML